jgi:methionyl-tRNA formyltransferase
MSGTTTEPDVSRLRTALLFQDGNFVGREYYRSLKTAGRCPDLLIAAGQMSADSVERERVRTGGKWDPPAIPATESVNRFDRLDDPALWDLLRHREIDVAVQGGIGVLKPDMIAAPRIGFINVHPGRLPQYRGNSCPEWAIYYGDPVVATAHFIDEGIDTGPVICERTFTIEDGWTYEDMRARLYAHCAGVLLEALSLLDRAGRDDARKIAQPQAAQGAHYWPPIPAAELAKVKGKFPVMAKAACS